MQNDYKTNPIKKLEDDIKICEQLKIDPAATYSKTFAYYDSLEYIINLYVPKYNIKVQLSTHEQRMLALFDKRRSMTLIEITEQIRSRVSIFGIYKSACKSKEQILNFENKIKELKDQIGSKNEKIRSYGARLQENE